MSKLKQEQVDDVIRRFRMHPIEFEERISTLDRPLIIESACPGWQPKYWGPREIYPAEPLGYEAGGVRFAAVPISIDEQVKANVEAVQIGAAAIHFHPRDPELGISLSMSPKSRVMHTKLMSEILSRTFSEVDVVTLQHTWKAAGPPPTNYKQETGKTLAAHGIDYISDT